MRALERMEVERFDMQKSIDSVRTLMAEQLGNTTPVQYREKCDSERTKRENLEMVLEDNKARLRQLEDQAERAGYEMNRLAGLHREAEQSSQICGYPKATCSFRCHRMGRQVPPSG